MTLPATKYTYRLENRLAAAASSTPRNETQY
jgi:hypothetical protein